MALALSTTLFFAACATDRARYLSAVATRADASIAVQAAEDADDIPDQPADCRKREAAGIGPGDRLDVAVVKYDAALGRANARAIRCAEWHDDLKAARNRTGGAS